MPITLPGNKRINQLAAVIAVGFAVAAVWQEFGSRGEPGENEFADAAMKPALKSKCNITTIMLN